MIDIRKLKELVRLMVANDLSEIDLRDSEEQVTLHRPSPYSTPQVTHQVVAAAPSAVAAAGPQAEVAAAADDTAGVGGGAEPDGGDVLRGRLTRCGPLRRRGQDGC